jgi:hypothetical protein
VAPNDPYFSRFPGPNHIIWVGGAIFDYQQAASLAAISASTMPSRTPSNE